MTKSNAINDTPINNVLITVVAQLGAVTVYQTLAYQTLDNEDCGRSLDGSIAQQRSEQNNKQMTQAGQTSYGELNLGLHVNDNAAQVLTNRMRLLAAINEQINSQQAAASIPQRSPIKRLHWVSQVHGKQIHDIQATTLNISPVAADAMVSQQLNVGLAIMTADCVPIVLYQPSSGQIAAIHAGWQGLACGVIKATAERFYETGQIMAWIGVCISQSNYEVGSHVRDQLLKGCIGNKSLSTSNIENFQQRYVLAVNSDCDIEFDTLHKASGHKTIDKLANNAKVDAGKVKLNLPRLAADQLQALGISVDNERPIDCSYADLRYYSYRRQTHLQQPDTGRMALVIVRNASLSV